MKTSSETALTSLPLLTVDVVLLTLKSGQLHVALHHRDKAPFADTWALPGGYVHPQEDLDAVAAAVRILHEKTGVQSPYLEQLATFAGTNRDPRGWSVSITYYAVVAPDALSFTNPEEVKWVPVENVTTLPFDHADIVRTAVDRVRAKTVYSSLPAHLMPDTFTLTQLQSVYETVLGTALDKRTFRRWVESLDLVQDTGTMSVDGAHRPAQLYSLRPAFRRQLAMSPRSLELR